MDELPDEEAWDTELDHWLSCESRCFGDKGDVEDITEGQWTLEQPQFTTGHPLMSAYDHSGHNINRRI